MTRPAPTSAGAASRPGPRRLPALDVLRGIAILGTLLTNIWIFTSPTSPVQVAMSGTPVADEFGIGSLLTGDPQSVIRVALGLVTDGKFIGLLTIMFGIGLEIQRQAAIRRGDAWPGGYPWRAGLLVLDGLLNYIFVFEFDVLMGYGLTGLLVCFILGTSERAQKVWMTVGICLHLLLTTATTLLLHVDLGEGAGGGDADRVAVLADRAIEQGWTPERTAAEASRLGLDAQAVGDQVRTVSDVLAAGPPGTGMSTASYWGQVTDRLTGFVGGRGEIPIMVVMGLGLFLVGAHLYRAGLFLPEGARLRRRVMLASFGIGLPIDWACRLFFEEAAGSFPRYVTSTLVSFGILALVAHLYARRTHVGRLGRPFQLVGTMALTCYIAQNLLCSIVFYDWGLGLANRMPQEYSTYLTLLIYLGLCAVLVGFSALWLRTFSRGPVELAWHASYEAIMRRRGPAIAARARRRAQRRQAKIDSKTDAKASAADQNESTGLLAH